MHFIADFHIHSYLSRATSRDMNLENIFRWAQIKGIDLIGTGDFTHPLWFEEIRKKLEPAEEGLFSLKKEFRDRFIPSVPANCRRDIRFILSAEVSSIYSKNGRVRKIHNIILSPDFKTASNIAASLSKIGNLLSDGRPILGLDAKELLKIVLNAGDGAMLIPAHAWTPHFSVLGAASGFDSLEECFEELTPYVYAIETGLSSNPAMNWRLSQLDNITLISNSDAHSPEKLGREANIFDTEISYKGIKTALETREGFSGTIEFFPEEGKYHYDGHRACKTVMHPSETKKNNNLCPVCKKGVTIGVMHRVSILADRDEAFKPKGMPPYESIIPLAEILSKVLGVGVNTKKVETAYMKMVSTIGNEFHILRNADIAAIAGVFGSPIASGIEKVRKGEVELSPGYDGEYGKIQVLEYSKDKKEGYIQTGLF